MSKRKKVKAIEESSTGRIKIFQDQGTGQIMSRSEFVKKIKRKQYSDYHIRKIRGVDTPVSNPDKNNNNNLR